MGINLGQTSMKAVYLGQTAVKSVFFGNEQVWGGGSPTPPTPTGDWLCFTAEEANSSVQLDKVGSPNAISLETSVDGASWTDYSWTDSTGDTLALANVGDKVYIRAKNENQTIGISSSNYYKFVMTGKIAASGNIQTLLKADGSRTDAPAYCYRNMFKGCTSLTTAPSLPATTLAQGCCQNMFASCTSLTSAPATLPATTLADNCYSYMFYGCTSLTSAPSLPATTLANNCYYNMFQGCTSLTTAPSLPAMTLANFCYNNMFQGCTSLTTAPSLPAMTLANFCYYSMFKGCTSLTAAPELPATTLAQGCYQGMFQNCTSLTSAPSLPATTLAGSCYSSMFQGCSLLNSVEVAFTTWTSGATDSWLQNVAAAGTFTCPEELPDIRGVNNIPVGWTKKDTIIPLCFTATQANSTLHLDKFGSPNAISLETSTDGSTWTDYSWTSNTGDTLTLANVGDKVYMRAKTENQTIGSSNSNYYRFYMTGKIAASGNIQTLLKADGSRTDAPNYCYYYMFNGCTSLTSAPELPATTLANSCYQSMFQNCTSLTAAPALPATTLASNCYQSMFEGCTSLTAAPSLPATTLARYCYSYMFEGCTSLTTAPILPATIFDIYCCLNMFYDSTSLSSVEVKFSDWQKTVAATSNWLRGVAASGTFKCPTALGTNETIDRGRSYCPEGWTVVNTDAA